MRRRLPISNTSNVLASVFDMPPNRKRKSTRSFLIFEFASTVIAASNVSINVNRNRDSPDMILNEYMRERERGGKMEVSSPRP